MTNTIYFHNSLRSHYSSSSFSSSVDWSDQTSHAAVAEEEEAARTPTQLEHQQEEEDDDEATTKKFHARRHLPAKTGEKKSTQKSASKFVSPTSQYSAFKRFDIVQLKAATRNFLASKFVSPISQYSAFKRFDIVQLKAATRNFDPWPASRSNYDLVFNGWVDEHKLTATMPGTGIAISVIRLNSVGIRDYTESLEKVIRLGHLHHPNLLRLLGYCPDDKNLLVYEFTLRGSLRNLLGGLNFPWSQRLNVALDAAKGLAFIHSSNIVHGCFKSSNILLNSKYSAKLLGLGLPSPATSSIETLETPIVDINYDLYFETVYNAPEYRHTGRSSAESDVYSFGVVLLEIVYARPAYQKFGPLAKWDLVRWIKSHRNLKSASVGIQAVRIALWCLSDHVNFRPTMDQVVEALEKLLMENNRHAL